MNDNHIEARFNELVLFVRQQTAEYNLPITRSTLIEDDLGVTGDDAYDLIVAFGKKYNVDISDFDCLNYFYDEPSIFDLQSKIIKPFTIGHLEKAMLAGKLNEETITS